MGTQPRVVLYRHISELEKELRSPKSLDATSKVFFVPTSRDKKLLQDILLPQGAWGHSQPAIWRWEDLTQNIVRVLHQKGVRVEPRRQIDPPDHWLIIRHILKEYLGGCPENSPLPPGVRQPGFASILGAHCRELLREAIQPETLGLSLGCSRCTPTSCPLEKSGEGVLCLLYHQYVRYLSAYNLMDSAQVPLVTLELLEKGGNISQEWIEKQNFLFVGFLSFSSSQKVLLSEIMNMGGHVSIFSPTTGIKSLYTTIDQFPWGTLESTPSSQTTDCIRVTAGSPRMEIEVLAREMVLWHNQKGYFSVAAPERKAPSWDSTGVLIERSSLSLTEEVLKRYRIPYSVNEGLTVDQTPLWDLAQRIWEVGEEWWPLEKTWSLLREPCLAGKELQTPPPPDIFSLSEEGWNSLLQQKAPERGVGSFKKMVSFVKKLRTGGTPSDLLQALYSLATDAPSWGPELSEWAINHPELDEALRRLNAALRETEHKIENLAEVENRIGPAGQDTLSNGHAMTFLCHWASVATIWLPPSVKGALALYVGTPPVLTQRSLWIMPGLTAAVWPGKLSESPLLPDHRKAILHEITETERGHLPLLKEKRQQREGLFRRLLACGEEAVIISSPAADSSGRPLPVTPFMGNALLDGWIALPQDIDPLERSLSKLLPGEDDCIIEKVEIRENAYPFQGAKRQLPVDHHIAPQPLHGQLSKLDDYINCPFRFSCTTLFDIKGPTSFGADPRNIGSALHTLWDKVWSVYLKEKEPLPYLVPSFWEQALQKSYPQLLESSYLVRYRENLLSQCLSMAEIQQSIEEAGLAELRQQQYREKDLPVLTIGGVPFTGRADRIEYLRDGRILIFDYKLGKSNGRNKSLQLAAYGLALLEGEGVLPAPIQEISGTIYVCHEDCTLTGYISSGDLQCIVGVKNGRDNMGLQRTMDEAKQGLKEMAQSLISTQYPPRYNSDVCRYCSLTQLCRRSELSGRGEENDEE